MEIYLAAGVYDIDLKFENTLVRKIGNGFSLIGLVLFAFSLIGPALVKDGKEISGKACVR